MRLIWGLTTAQVMRVMEREDDGPVLRALTEEPESATAIFLRIEGLPEDKSLTTALRKRRRAVAKRLELLAEEGRIERREGNVADGEYPIPLYYR